MATTAQENTNGTPDQGAVQQAQELAGEAKERAQKATTDIRGRLASQVDDRSTMAGEQITSQVSDVRAVADQLRQQGKEKPAEIAEQVAQRAERVGNYLTDADSNRLLGDAERLGRERPWAVIGAGMALGFAASRFLKASSGERYRASTSNGNGTRAIGTGTAGTATSTGTTAGNGAQGDPTPVGYSIGAPNVEETTGA